MWVGAEWGQKVFGWKAGKPVAEANGGRVQSTHSSASKPQKNEHDGKPVNCGTKAANHRWSQGVQGSRTAMKTPRQKAAPSVSAEPNKQGAEVCVRWAWTEAAVWTRPMLVALERGIEGGRWYSLNDKVGSAANLEAAWQKVKRNKGAAGPDRQSVEQYERRAKAEQEAAQKGIREGSWKPQPARRVMIPKAGSKEKRPLGIPNVKDRVVQAALKQVLEPIFERDFSDNSYGFRPGRGAKEAIERVEENLLWGSQWIVDIDIKGYFDNIPHELLMDCVKQKIADSKVLGLIEKFLKVGIMSEMKEREPSEAGTPQGGVISPLLANIYLDELDHLMSAKKVAMTRYADDFVIQCETQEQAQTALESVREWTSKRGLTLHPEKTRIVNAGAGEAFEFLGYRFVKWRKWPRRKSEAKVRAGIREATPRLNGKSMKEIITKVNRVISGWYEYFSGASSPNPMEKVDGYVRKRLRGILRKRSKRKGSSYGGEDHKRWRNDWFMKAGLYCLSAAWKKQHDEPPAGVNY